MTNRTIMRHCALQAARYCACSDAMYRWLHTGRGDRHALYVHMRAYAQKLCVKDRPYTLEAIAAITLTEALSRRENWNSVNWTISGLRALDGLLIEREHLVNDAYLRKLEWKEEKYNRLNRWAREANA